MYLGVYLGKLAKPYSDLLTRSYGGITSTLYFNIYTGKLVVQVENGDDSFGLYDLDPCECVDVFNHPFIYRINATPEDIREREPADLYEAV